MGGALISQEPDEPDIPRGSDSTDSGEAKGRDTATQDPHSGPPAAPSMIRRLGPRSTYRNVFAAQLLAAVMVVIVMAVLFGAAGFAVGWVIQAILSYVWRPSAANSWLPIVLGVVPFCIAGTIAIAGLSESEGDG